MIESKESLYFWSLTDNSIRDCTFILPTDLGNWYLNNDYILKLQLKLLIPEVILGIRLQDTMELVIHYSNPTHGGLVAYQHQQDQKMIYPGDTVHLPIIGWITLFLIKRNQSQFIQFNNEI